VPLLAQEFLDRLAHELGREVSGISEEALRLLMDTTGRATCASWRTRSREPS